MRKLILAIVILFTTLSTMAYGICFDSSSHVSLLFDAAHYTYQEPSGDNPSLEIKGSHFGIGLKYANLFKNAVYLSSSGRLSGGFVDYQGFEGQGQITNAVDNVLHFRLLTGYALSKKTDFVLIPYTGIAYRLLYNRLNLGSINSVLQVHFPLRIIQYGYTPIGFIIKKSMSPKTGLSLSAEYDFFWGGSVTTYPFKITPDGPTTPQVTNTQSTGYGLHATLNLLIQHSKHLITIGPYIQYWHINDSNTVTKDGFDFTEPDNSTVEFGLEGSFLF